MNSDGTTTEHPQYYTDYEPIDFSIDERAVTNDGQFVVVESKSPYGYYGDWTGDEDRTNYEAEDAGKRLIISALLTMAPRSPSGTETIMPMY